MKKSPVSVEGIPVANSAQYLGIWLNDPKKEESRVIRSLFCRANQTLKQNNVSLCTVNTKKQLVTAHGSVYGIESLTSISSKMKGAHRYLVKQVFQKEWRSLADLSNTNDWLHKVSDPLRWFRYQITSRNSQDFAEQLYHQESPISK